MDFIWLMPVGLIAGWLTGMLVQGGGFGVLATSSSAPSVRRSADFSAVFLLRRSARSCCKPAITARPDVLHCLC